ncbi:hypothetical protein [Promicromonospora sp. NPDC050880]|uniref:hypothetical protein n=1 Tax=Promicromonospora sp. NPDC050880 TaxID=3364406 RepID=UPI0037A99C9A
MAVTGADLIEQVGGDPEADLPLADKIVARAERYVTKYREDSEPDPAVPVVVPEEALDGALLACAEDIWTRTKSQNGVMLTNYEGAEDGGVVVRIGRDPLAPVRPLLDPWYPPAGFA